MRIVCLSLLLLSAVGCASKPMVRLSCDELCAVNGMVCKGMSIGNTYASGQTFNSASNKPAYDSFYSSGSTTYQCAMDPTASAAINEIKTKLKARIEALDPRPMGPMMNPVPSSSITN